MRLIISGVPETLSRPHWAELKGGSQNVPKSKTSGGWPVRSAEGNSKRNGIGGSKTY